MLESHVRLRLKTNACAEDIGQSSTLLGQCVDDRGAGRSQGGLQHVAEDAEDAVEVLVAALRAGVFPLNASHHLSNDDKVNDERRGQQRVLADVEQTVQNVSYLAIAALIRK